ncbi:hypothetical protein HXX76_009119 [Chlamydomonas incerta]|uniref:Methanethiol oxidase n=1 Tax=Chlamydomonas incerta TaxID=51695 RepID=A0A835T1P9_CHLIN|nr:hypothetical protein HXX76_009119 [Chlamydomonas incerta]|eukprot:KAG2432199.1 hypothetical protein HXX76_009119 [Chlamydomonas incerta]
MATLINRTLVLVCALWCGALLTAVPAAAHSGLRAAADEAGATLSRVSRSLRGASGAAAPPAPKYVYTWAGAKDPSLGGKDSLFVISLEDKEFGKVVGVVPTPYAGMEPHHCTLSLDRRTLGCGGLFAALAGTPGVLFFNVSGNPRAPTLIDPATVPQPRFGAFADEFIATPDGGFLVTLMGSPTGGSPGRIARYDAARKLVAEYPDPARFADATTLPGFNPHGMGVSWNHKVALSVDYLEPASTLNGQVVTKRSTLRLWNTSDWSAIAETIDGSGAEGHINGPMDAVAIGDTGTFLFGGGNGYIYYLDGRGAAPHAPKLVWDLLGGAMDRTSYGCILYSFRSGTRLLASAFVRNMVQLLDTTDPLKPKLLDTLQLPKGAGGHVVRLSADETTGAVATYFLDEGSVGQVHFEGDLTVRLFKLNAKATKIITKKPAKSVVDFKTRMGAQGAFRPHGVAFY